MAKKKKEEMVEQEDLVMEEKVEEMVEEETEEEVNPELINEDGKELLFPDGPTLDQVEEWKSLHGEIYLTEFDDEVLIWRGIKRNEYKQIMKQQGADQYYREERICERCVLWPENYGFQMIAEGKAGTPSLVAEFIMEKSGFQPKTGAMRL